MSVLASGDDPDARPSLIADWQDDPPQADDLRMLSGLASTHGKRSARSGEGRHGSKSGRSREPQRLQRAVPRWVVAGLALVGLVLAMVYVWFVVHHAGMPPYSLPKGDPAALTSRRIGNAALAATIETVKPGKGSSEGDPFSQLAVPVDANAASAAPAPFSSLGAQDQASTQRGKGARAASAGLASSLPSRGKTTVTRAANLPFLQRPASEPERKKGAVEELDAVSVQTDKPPTLSTAQRRQAAREADAALLSALVSHVSAHSREEVDGAMPPLRLAGGQMKPMTTIAQIVGHCRTFQGEEAKQCRVRICENYWGKDDACTTRPSFLRSERID